MDDIQKLRLFFQTIGDANRLRIIHVIGDQERSVSEIVSATKLSQPLVSHHLRTLKENQILDTRRKGPFIYYKVHNIDYNGSTRDNDWSMKIKSLQI